MLRFMKFIFIGYIISFGYLANATTDNIFSRFDNNANFNLNFENGVSYNNINAGLNASILADNIWYNINVGGVLISDTNSGAPVSYNGFGLNGKIGYAFLMNNSFNLIPYLGVGLSNHNAYAHVDSQPIFTYTFTNSSLYLGIKPEYALTDKLKLSLDTNFIYRQEAQIVPNSLYTQAHSDIYNNYITTTPAIQWNPVGNLNLELYYLYPINLTNNITPYNIINQGYSSQAIANSASVFDNTVGINIGWLF